MVLEKAEISWTDLVRNATSVTKSQWGEEYSTDSEKKEV